MIKAARLKERNPQLGLGMRTYTTASTGTKYTSGYVGKPSPLRIVADIRELEEIKNIDQFEILEFQNTDDLHEKLQIEMEERSRLGQPAVRAEVISEAGALDAQASQPVADRKLDDITPDDEPQTEDTSDDDDEPQAFESETLAEESSVDEPSEPSGGSESAAPKKDRKKGARKGRKAKK